LAIDTGYLLVLVGPPAFGTVVSALKRNLLLASVAGVSSVTMFVLWVVLASGSPEHTRFAPQIVSLVALLSAWAPLVGSVRIARPGSWWWRNRYSYTRQVESVSRFQSSSLNEPEQRGH
jgi:hypothetical protein